MYGMEELCEAVVSSLRTTMAANKFFSPNYCVRLMSGKRIPPTAGNEFIAVRPGTLTNTDPVNSQAKRIEHTITVGLTTRVNGVPHERVGDNVLTVDQTATTYVSMLTRAKQICNAINNNIDIINSANEKLTQDTGCFIVKPLGFVSMDAEPEEVYEDHFDLPDEARTSERYVGLLLEIQFGGAVFSSPS